MSKEIETIEIHGESSVDWQATAMRYIELNSQKVEAIQRVREIQQKLERFGDRFDPSLSTTQVFRGVAEELKQALDGEQE